MALVPQTFNIVHRLQVLDANQHDIPTMNHDVRITQLISVGKGTREFVMLRFQYANGHMDFYVNELDKSGQVQEIVNDEEFEEISTFMDLALNRIKPEGSDI